MTDEELRDSLRAAAFRLLNNEYHGVSTGPARTRIADVTLLAQVFARILRDTPDLKLPKELHDAQ